MEDASMFRRWGSFLLSVLVLWALVFEALPALTHSVQEIQTLADFVDFSGIETGKWYYTDIECVGHADHNARSTMEYEPMGPVAAN